MVSRERRRINCRIISIIFYFYIKLKLFLFPASFIIFVSLYPSECGGGDATLHCRVISV